MWLVKGIQVDCTVDSSTTTSQRAFAIRLKKDESHSAISERRAETRTLPSGRKAYARHRHALHEECIRVRSPTWWTRRRGEERCWLISEMTFMDTKERKIAPRANHSRNSRMQEIFTASLCLLTIASSMCLEHVYSINPLQKEGLDNVLILETETELTTSHSLEWLGVEELSTYWQSKWMQQNTPYTSIVLLSGWCKKYVNEDYYFNKPS